MHSNTKDMTGMRIGKLVIIRLSHKRRGGSVCWVCKCDCGKTKVYVGNDLRRGEIVSCGCYRKRARPDIAARFTKHGHSKNGRKSGTYSCWGDMLGRCNNLDHSTFCYYGARGIKVCRRWHKFENFLVDMGEKPEGLTLERKDNNKGYYKANCKWATRFEQIHNRRNQGEWRAPPGPVPGTVRHSLAARRKRSLYMKNLWKRRRGL